MSAIGLATIRARGLLRRVRPDVVLGMGGFASVPVALAAAYGRPPLVLHEQNAHLSFAQKIPLRRARVLAMGLPIEEQVDHPRKEMVGNPVRSAIASIASMDENARAGARAAARARLDLDPAATTILVLGGSLGSGPLNETLPTIALPSDVQVLHVAGPSREATTAAAWAASPARVRVVGFLDAIEDAYLAADVAVCRSGALTVSELAVASLPAVLVPLETLARGDQAANARVLERAGAAVVVAQSGADLRGRLSAALGPVLHDPSTRARMRDGARSVARPQAASHLADVVGSAHRG